MTFILMKSAVMHRFEELKVLCVCVCVCVRARARTHMYPQCH